MVLLAAGLALLALWAASPTAAQRAITNSAILAAGATAIALPLGTILAILIARCDLPGRRLAGLAMLAWLWLRFRPYRLLDLLRTAVLRRRPLARALPN